MFSFGFQKTCIFGLGALVLGLSLTLLNADKKALAVAPDKSDLEFALPNNAWMKSNAEQVPIVFLNRSQNAAEWDKLASFWNKDTQKITDTITGKQSEMAIVKIKVPLGLTQNPPVPVENLMTVAKWNLGKKIYFDPILSSNNTVSCASCHDPKMGFTDQSSVSTGINGKLGGMSAPSVYNSAYSLTQFWDGRAPSLEAQCQGPPQNSSEMFDGKGNAWDTAVIKLRAIPEYVSMFKDVFGTLPTRDGAAKAIAAYERTVLTGNSIHDRTELTMRKRVADEETGKFEVLAKDYEKVLSEAIAAKDSSALQALGLKGADKAEISELARSINNGRVLFNGKARCNGCHVGDSFSDSQFHNLGVGAKDGQLPEGMLGRFGAQPTGQKNPELIGAFKTPLLRHLLPTAPYMHDGSLKTLEEVVDFYEKGGKVNPFLDVRMRDYASEKASGNSKAIQPLALGLTPFEKKDLVNFMKALNGEVADAIVIDPSKFAN